MQRLRLRAAKHGRSMEDEAREILKGTLSGKDTGREDLAWAIQKRFAANGGLELPVMEREPIRELGTVDS